MILWCYVHIANMAHRQPVRERRPDEPPLRELEVFSVFGSEPMATREVADLVGHQHDTTRDRLQQLKKKELLNSKKIAASTVWFLPAAR